MKSNDVTVSVVMATYNGEKYIQEQLDSILSQTYPILEIIIQDDASTDTTQEILKRYALSDSRIKLFFNERNIGYNNNFHKACKSASGTLVALSDQDDIWFPDKLEKQVNAIGDNVMCYSNHITGLTMVDSKIVSYKNAPEQQLFKAIVGHSMLLKREFVQDDSVWLEGMPYDIGFSILSHFRGGVAKVDETLNWHRRLPDSVSHRGSVDTHYSPIVPYIFGLANFRKIKRQEHFHYYYNRILAESSGKNELVHKLSKLMLKDGIISLLRIQFICFIHRETIYPSEDTHGVKGMLRGFFFPFIHAFRCDFYR